MNENTRSSFEAHGKTYTAVIFPEDDVFVAECPEIGTVSQGESVEDALINLTEATELYIQEFILEEHDETEDNCA